MNKEILDLIKKYRVKGDLFGEVSEEYIQHAEATLNLKFPKGYREYVKNFGSGGICGIEI